MLAALYVVMSVCVSFGAAALWTGRGVRTRTVLVALANSLGAPLFLLWRGDGGVVVAAAVTIQAGIIGLLCLNKAYETVTYRMRKRRDPCVVMAQRGDWEGLAVAANRRRLPAKRAEVALRAALSSSRRRPPEERAPLSLLVRLYECVPDATADSWMSAAVPGSHEFTEWLLDRAPRLPRIGGNTLANTTDPRTFQLLAARGVDLDVRSAPGAPTPLLKAATPHIAMLLLKAGADPNATADYQDTPEGWTLQLARREGRSAPHLWSPAKGPSWDDVVGCANEISASIHD